MDARQRAFEEAVLEEAHHLGIDPDAEPHLCVKRPRGDPIRALFAL